MKNNFWNGEREVRKKKKKRLDRVEQNDNEENDGQSASSEIVNSQRETNKCALACSRFGNMTSDKLYRGICAIRSRARTHTDCTQIQFFVLCSFVLTFFCLAGLAFFLFDECVCGGVLVFGSFHLRAFFPFRFVAAVAVVGFVFVFNLSPARCPVCVYAYFCVLCHCERERARELLILVTVFRFFVVAVVCECVFFFRLKVFNSRRFYRWFVRLGLYSLFLPQSFSLSV